MDIALMPRLLTKKLIIAGLIIASLLAAALFAVNTSAAPVDVLQTCNSGSTVCQGSVDSNTTVSSLLRNVINLLLMIVGIVAVITIIVAGIRYVTSGGDGQQTKNARDTILYAIVGLVVAIMAFPIVNFVIDKI